MNGMRLAKRSGDDRELTGTNEKKKARGKKKKDAGVIPGNLARYTSDSELRLFKSQFTVRPNG